MEAPGIERRIKWASSMVAAGLLIQLLSFLKLHPLAFVAFIALGVPLTAGGAVLYLISIVAAPHASVPGPGPQILPSKNVG